MNNPSTCPHYSLCSGCQIPDLHPPIWEEIKAFFQPLAVTLHIDGFVHTRAKAKLSVRSGPKIGLYKEHTHEVISIPECLVHHPSINQAAAILREEILRHKLSIYTENPPSGNLRYIQCFVELSTGKVQLSLILSHPEEPFCQSLLQYPLWHSLWVNIHKTNTNRILSDTWHHLHGEPFLWQTIYKTQIAFHPAAFCQNHLSLFEKMIQKIETYIQPTDRILEIYAGVGAIGLNLHKKAPDITFVENNLFAHLSFQQSQTQIPYHCIDAKDADLTGYNTILVDPPRKGLDPSLLQRLCNLKQTRLIYVSCNFETFKRDCNALLASNWKIKEANGYLLFPGTNHVEILAFFER